MLREIWRNIPGFPYYEVSDQGRVRSDHPRRSRPGRIVLRGVRDRDGYQRVSLRGPDGRPATRGVHRLVLLAFVGPCPDGEQVRHLNGDPADNRLANLTYGTPSENRLDTVAHGNHHNASKSECVNGHALTDDNVYEPPTRPGHRQCRQCRRERNRVAQRVGASC